MQLLISVAVLLGITATAALAQIVQPLPAAQPSTREQTLARDKAYAAAVTDCENMWDRGTHMPKKDWTRTCRRVQDRLRRYELN